MNGRTSSATTLHLVTRLGRGGGLLIGVVAALLAHEALAARAKTAPVSVTQTNPVGESAAIGFDPQLVCSVYKPEKTRDPFLKAGSAGVQSGAINKATANDLAFRLQAIFWSPRNPSAVVNDRLINLNESVIFSTASGNVEVKAVEIGRQRVVLEVAGQRIELTLNPELPSGAAPRNEPSGGRGPIVAPDKG
jgi:hypothetical protein